MTSREKNDHLFPVAHEKNLNEEIMKQISKILQFKYKNSPSALKQINLETSISARSIRNWRNGRNPPSAAHLLMLAYIYPAVLNMILHLSGHEYLSPHIYEKNVPVNVPDEFAIDCLNERQKWIVFHLALNRRVITADIARVWCVTDRTAKRDLADLKRRGYIVRRGSFKRGRYLLSR
jgi:transcriptional regulator with XRE-family HTH domain